MIYKTTELKLIQDDSEDLVETWQFMQRRIEDVQRIGSGINSISAAFAVSGEICHSGYHWVYFLGSIFYSF